MSEFKALAGCVIPNQAGEILLLHRNTPELEQLELPGGKVEDETEAQAAIRETREELGVEVEIVRALGGAPFSHNAVDYYYFWFLGKIVSGEPFAKENMHQSVGYYDITKEYDVELSINIVNLRKAMQSGKITL
jgi:8-oxo-dGTP pyrophosphatase MutT (NUDIX family)